MKAKELKQAIDKFIGATDNTDYRNGAQRFLNDFAEDLFPALAEVREKEEAMGRLTYDQRVLLGLNPDGKADMPWDDDDCFEELSAAIATFEKATEQIDGVGLTARIRKALGNLKRELDDYANSI